MSKIPVGEGFSFPDTTEQETAGVISDSTRALFYSLSGDSSLNGLTPEKAKGSIQNAIDAAQALVPSPSTGVIATVSEAEGGVYFEDITLYDNVLFEGTKTTIVTSGLVGISAASSQSFRPQAIITNTDNTSLVLIDEQEQFGLDVRSMTLGGDGCIGFDIRGYNSGIYITASEVRIANDNVTVVSYTGASDIPPDFNYNTITLGGSNSTFFVYDSSDPNDTADVNVSSLNEGEITAFAIGTTGFDVRSGILKVRAGSLSSAMVVKTLLGGVVTVSANVIGGATYSEGSVVYDTVGVIVGRLETTATGTILWRGTSITGDAINAGNMSIMCVEFNGEIVNTGNMYVHIGAYTGTMPVDDGSIDGVINGVLYGNRKVGTSWGDISGILSDQTDLKNSLDLKADQSDLDLTNIQVLNNATAIGLKADKVGDALTNTEVNGVTLTSTGFAGFVLDSTGNYIQTNSNSVINGSTVSGTYVTQALNTLNSQITVYGSERQYVEDLTRSDSTTQFSNPTVKLSITTPVGLPAGTYKITADFLSLMDKDGWYCAGIWDVTAGAYVKDFIDYKSDENNNRFPWTIISPDLVISGARTFELHFGPEINGPEASMSDATMELIRVA